MSGLAPTLHLLLLAESSDWALRLRACLAELKLDHPLVTAEHWSAAASVFDRNSNTLVLATAAHMPAPGSCPHPLILLLDHEPFNEPIGVSDWLSKEDLSAAMLRRVLRYSKSHANLQDTVRRLAEQDALTGIANRQGFQAVLAAKLAQGGEGLVLGSLDLDNFKQVNDALGQQGGDRLILQTVARLRNQLGNGDFLARLGGDEFALLIDTRGDARQAECLAERITEVLAEPYWINGEGRLIGCSLGLAAVGEGDSVDQVLWHAQIAMQQAKASQGCTFYVYDPLQHGRARSTAELDAELRRALRRDELELHYQPRQCLRTRQVVGLEALVRWRHPQRGLLGPDEFVPLAEQSGLIVPLGYWVIARALRDLQWLLGRGLPPLHMAVNLSFRQFQDSQLLNTLQRLINERGIDGHWLEFELTETAVMRRSDQVKRTMEALGALGVRFSLDDFGTGFSSFVHLSSLPITLLKIDKSFVGAMRANGEGGELVRAVVGMAHNLGLEVVAEGVENTAQLEQLRGFHCDQVQGYLISRPLPLNELARFLVYGQRQALLES